MISGRLVAVQKQTYKEQKTTLENGHPEGEKVKTNFQCVIPTWEKRKNTRHIFQNRSDIF